MGKSTRQYTFFFFFNGNFPYKLFTIEPLRAIVSEEKRPGLARKSSITAMFEVSVLETFGEDLGGISPNGCWDLLGILNLLNHAFYVCIFLW